MTSELLTLCSEFLLDLFFLRRELVCPKVDGTSRYATSSAKNAKMFALSAVEHFSQSCFLANTVFLIIVETFGNLEDLEI